MKSIIRTAIIAAISLTQILATTPAHAGQVTAHVQTKLALPNATDTYRVRFKGRELALVHITGDGSTDLDLYVYDADGQLVASDDDPTDDCMALWLPLATADFTIRVVNRGEAGNDYQFETN